jgi:hypothetical protein
MSFRSGYPEPKPGLFPEQETDPEIIYFFKNRNRTGPWPPFNLWNQNWKRNHYNFFKEPEPEVVRKISNDRGQLFTLSAPVKTFTAWNPIDWNWA